MKLFLMSLATVTVTFDPAEEPKTLPVPGYLIQTDTGEHILVDTGLSQRAIDAIDLFPFHMEEQQDVVHQLAKLWLSPTDIHTVICSHFDIDHIGNLAAFPEAQIVVQRSQYQVALKGDSRSAESRDQWDAPGRQILLLDGDTELLPGITLVESSGHSPGHQSVLVRLKNTGPVLLAIDAIPFQIQLDPERRRISPLDMDEEGVRASARKLVALIKQEGVSLVIHGHDPEQWRHLQLLPQYYD